MSASPRPSRLSRKEWALVACGAGAWLVIAWAGVWFVHQMTRSTADCGTQLEARGLQAHPAQTAGPRNSLQLLTGTGRCK